MTSRLPSTQSLQCFESSARLGSFTAAGVELNLTQGGVSRQVLTLEAGLGAQLLERKPSGLKLTPSGLQYLDAILPALKAIEIAGSNLQAQRGQSGVLNLSIPASWGNYWLIPRLPLLNQKYPQLNVNLFTKVGRADFGNRLIDAAIEFYPIAPKDPCEFVMPIQLHVYANPVWAKQHSKAWQQAKLDPSMLLQHTTLPMAWREWQEAAGYSTAVAPTGSRFDLMFMCMHAAVGGSGVALLPDFMTQTLVKSRQLKRLSKVSWQPSGGYYLRASPVLRNAVALRQFNAWLQEQVLVSVA